MNTYFLNCFYIYVSDKQDERTKKVAINAMSTIDQELAKLYADKVTVNLDGIEKVSIEDVLSTMQIIATNNLALVKINFK